MVQNRLSIVTDGSQMRCDDVDNFQLAYVEMQRLSHANFGVSVLVMCVYIS
jgi:hypothetical protein